MGVRRAVDLTLDLVNRQKHAISTFGPLIHNPQVLDVLQDKGVGVLDHIPVQAAGTVIIRAHGVPPQQKEELKKSGLVVKDATCPRVLKVQAIISKHRKDGFISVIVGDKNHAEVDGLVGYAGPGCHVVSNEEEAARLRLLNQPYIIVSQTTQDEASFNKITAMITANNGDGRIFNTICDSTHLRQAEVRNLCREVEAVVVVGGRNSANTKRLAEIALGLGKEVFLIEAEDELDRRLLSQFDTVGVTAGASTPTWMINRVVRALEGIPGRSEGLAKPFLYRLIRMLMVTNLYVSAAGGMLTYACGLLQDLAPSPVHALISFGYLYAMHNINRVTDQRSKIFNDPLYFKFCEKNKEMFLGASVLSLTVALALATQSGLTSFLLLAVMSFFGVLYRIRFIPSFLADRIKVTRLKEIPGSKTMFVALAWALVVVVLPALGHEPPLGAKTLGCFLFILLLVFVRNALFDVFEVQGDRIVGKETLPVLIGPRKTIVLLNFIMCGLFLILLFFPMYGLMSSPLGYWVLPGLIYLMLYTLLYQRGLLSPGVRLEFGLETTFVLIFSLVLSGASL